MSLRHPVTEYLLPIWQKSTTLPCPLKEEIRLQIFGSPDWPGFPPALLSNGDSVYSLETLFEILGTPEKTCLICTETPVQTKWKFWQSQLL